MITIMTEWLDTIKGAVLLIVGAATSQLVNWKKGRADVKKANMENDAFLADRYKAQRDELILENERLHKEIKELKTLYEANITEVVNMKREIVHLKSEVTFMKLQIERNNVHN